MSVRVNASAHAVSGGPRLEAALRAGIGCHSEAAACDEAKRVEYVRIQLTLTFGHPDDDGCEYRSLSGPHLTMTASLSWIGTTEPPRNACVVCDPILLLSNCYKKLKEDYKPLSLYPITVESDHWMHKTCGSASMPSLYSTFDWNTLEGPSPDPSNEYFVFKLAAQLKSSPSYQSFLNGPTQTA